MSQKFPISLLYKIQRINVKAKIKQLILRPSCFIIIINLEGIRINKTIDIIKIIKINNNKSIE
jgi:hypothetical protein